MVAFRRADTVLAGLDAVGEERWRREAPWGYLAETGGRVLLTHEGGALLLDPASGETLAEWRPPPGGRPQLLDGSEGTLFAQSDAWLWIVPRGGPPFETYLPGPGRLETTAGDSALVRLEDGRHVLVGPDGALRGAFQAPGARFSAAPTRGGPYVAEPGRLRVGAFSLPPA